MRGHRPQLSVPEEFGYELGRLARWWRSQLDQRMRPTGLTQARWVVLVNLARSANGMLQKDVANHIGVEGPTLVRILDRIEQQGLIERRPAPTDRRGKTVHLTEKGWDIVAEFDRIAAELRGELLSGVDTAELSQCIRLFRRIRVNLEAGPQDTVADDQPQRVADQR